MKFLRDNAFLVATAIVTLAGIGVFTAMIASVSGAIGEFVGRRTGMSERISRLMVQKVNQTKVEEAKQNFELMRKMRIDVDDECLRLNRKAYPIISVSTSDKKNVPVFPVDAAGGNRDTLRLLFPIAYANAVTALVASLRPTTPPTTEELKDAADELRARQAGRSEGGMPMVEVAPRYGPGPYGPGPPGPGPSGRVPAYGHRTATQPETQPAAPPTPEEIATRRLVLERADKGWIYADERSLYMPMVTTEGQRVHYDETEIWLAQVALWVQMDVVSAISRTISEGGRSGARLDVKGVPASAIKRLNSLKVLGYLTKRSSVGAAGLPAPTGMMGVSGAESGGPQLAYLPVLSSVSASGGGGQSFVPMLTGRSCCPLYDVVHYQVSLVMPTGHLLRLYRNLMAENYHTILDVKLEPVAKAASERTDAPAPSGRGELYYYGSDPVVSATLTGEMLLLASFTRGQPDGKGGLNPQRPPLMPVEFLRKLSEQDPDALREEDKARLSAAPAPRTPQAGMPVPGGRPPAPPGGTFRPPGVEQY